MRIRYGIAAATAAAIATTAVPASAASGFSYMETVAPGTSLTVIATSGDTIGGVVLPGIPDGMGVLRNGDSLVVFVNHELSATNSVAAATPRAGGTAAGATVSALNVDRSTMAATGQRDMLSSMVFYNYQTGQFGNTPGAPTGAAAKDDFGTPNHTKVLNRFCSSYLAQPGELAFRTKDAAGKDVVYGYTGPAYFTGEEGTDESRAFVMDNNGNMMQLPRLGLAAWENLVVAPTKNMSTVIMGNEDGSATDSQLFMYVGTKTNLGHWTERAGLRNGSLYVMAVDGKANDNAIRQSPGKGASMPVTFQQINSDLSGKDQNIQARTYGTELARVEDGAFDPNNPNDYYFVTTESNKDPKATAPNPALPTVPRDGGALWRLRFNDVANPLAGASLTMLLDGTEGIYLNKPDNITIDRRGNLLIQEDPGKNDHISRVVAYRLSDGKLGTIAKFADKYFKPGGPEFMTTDEESSGVTDITDIMKTGDTDAKSYFILNAQVHAAPNVARPDLATNPEAASALKAAIEGGQIYILQIDDWSAIYK